MKAMRDLCAELDILFVADEVITAFGRTGPLFACEDDGIVPDLMTVAKGLTSGYVPMGAVLLADHVYQTIAEGAGAAAVGHGFTYSGHPVSAASVSRCSTSTRAGSWRTAGRWGRGFRPGSRASRDHPLVGDVRGRGCSRRWSS